MGTPRKPVQRPPPPLVPGDPGEFLAYGLSFPFGTPKRLVEGSCYAMGWTPERGGLGKYRHFVNMFKLTWPSIEWNPWMEDMILSLTSEEFEVREGKTLMRFLSWTGAGACGKTFNAGAFACAWWMMSPLNSIVILTSTTKDMVGKRIWPVIERMYFGAEDPDTGIRMPWGHMIPSRKIVQAVRADGTYDEKHAIHAMAVGKGETALAVENLKGQHAPRMMLVIDEANATPEAIFATIRNMRKGCQEFICLRIGNAVSHLDNHGRGCEPVQGWESITVESERWPTIALPDWDIDKGWCFHYDGAKSPNVVAGRTIYPHLYTYENWLHAQRNPDSAQYWSQERGFWPADGLLHTVLNMPLIQRYKAQEGCVFVRKSVTVAACDPGFGGDDCILVLADVGDIEAGHNVIFLRPPIVITPRMGNDIMPLDHQIGEEVKRICLAEGVKGEHLATDATGIGKGVASWLYEHWSADVLRLEWGGMPSELPAGPDDPRPGREAYDRRVTELWFNVRECVVAGRLRGLTDRMTLVDFCSREYDLVDRKLRLATKDDCKKTLGRSPDRGDATCALVELCRQRGLVTWGAMPAVLHGKRAWDRKVIELDNELHGHFNTGADEVSEVERALGL